MAYIQRDATVTLVSQLWNNKLPYWNSNVQTFVAVACGKPSLFNYSSLLHCIFPLTRPEDGYVRMFLRGRPVTMHIPDAQRDSYTLDHKGAAPDRKLKLQWVYPLTRRPESTREQGRGRHSREKGEERGGGREQEDEDEAGYKVERELGGGRTGREWERPHEKDDCVWTSLKSRVSNDECMNNQMNKYRERVVNIAPFSKSMNKEMDAFKFTNELKAINK